MHLTVLRSGSSGNCSLVEHGTTRVLIDAGGQSQKGLAALFEQAALDPQTVTAVLVTHLHGDHVNVATMRLAQEHGLAVYMHSKNAACLPKLFRQAYRDGVTVREFASAPFAVGALSITPFGLSHDACGTTNGFRICPEGNAAQSLVYAADLGHVPESVLKHLVDAHTLFLESNHDVELLWGNPTRPYHHKKRVAGKRGHLSNTQCAEALAAIVKQCGRAPTRVILGHLSADHNSPDLALGAVKAALTIGAERTELVVAQRDTMTPRFEVGATAD